MKSENTLFNYSSKDNHVDLDLITINPRHEQSFLYHSEIGIDKIEALKKMMAYVEIHHQKENSYTIQWIELGEGELNTSYFRGKNMYDVLDKFFYQRDPNLYKIYSINLNPTS
ncbi:MAG: hypothetical protein HKN92_02920 [Chitinophagales bacterium]|nr:hypothetical protein [Chitinophagales bacterium]